MSELESKRCLPCEGGVAALTAEQAHTLLEKVPGWEIKQDKEELFRVFDFTNYYHTMAFVNAIAWMAHQENHHPDLEVGYNRCIVRYSTHAIAGLSDNDFICAAKVNQLFSQSV
jgi:4a-hydroxytetrahydrobiopterin dehydratase